MDIFPKACNSTDTHIHHTGRAKETEGNLLYIQLRNLQYFLAVAFKSTSCHADSSITDVLPMKTFSPHAPS